MYPCSNPCSLFQLNLEGVRWPRLRGLNALKINWFKQEEKFFAIPTLQTLETARTYQIPPLQNFMEYISNQMRLLISESMSIFAVPKRGYLCDQPKIRHVQLQMQNRFHWRILRNIRYLSIISKQARSRGRGRGGLEPPQNFCKLQLTI